MTDCKNLELAREWAADIDADRETLSQDTIDAAADLISSLPDEWVDANKVRDVIHKATWQGVVMGHMREQIVDDLEALLPTPPAPEPASPRPEDVPEGETWLIRPYENADPAPSFRVHASKYGQGRRWAYFRVGGSMIGFADDEDVTLIARLVPASAEQPETEQEFDPAYTYRDRDGDKWLHQDGAWRWASGMAGKVSESGHYKVPPAEYGPYTRIEA